MSGILGIVHFDGCPVDPRLLESLTGSMQARGPDDLKTWCEGPVGFGFAKLATTEEARREQQPLGFGDDLRIVADARIDGRRELRSKLGSASQNVRDATDVELICLAYQRWGEDAPQHLLGDFAFAIWDPRRRCLFCARDHFGVKPFYYATWSGGFVFSNTLACLRRHPAVTSKLDELAVADFLLFEGKLDAEATTFADIRRLIPAHALCHTPEGITIRRYWQLPTEGPPPGAPTMGWVERFRSLLGTAVQDRLRTDRITVLMSGGLDSTSVAATAQEHLVATGQPQAIRCLTFGFDRLIADREKTYAALVARHLSMAHEFRALDDYRLAERWGEIPVPPEPGNHLLDAIGFDHDLLLASTGRVVLTGHGGDPLLAASTGFFLDQLKQLRLGRAGRYLFSSLWRNRRLPPLGLHTREMQRRLRKTWRSGYPAWLDPDLESRQDLVERWRWFLLDRGPKLTHSNHPTAYDSLWDIGWANAFEQFDATPQIRPFEHRHPFFDLRLVEFLLRVPPVPWRLDKLLLREAMRGVLPEAVRSRSKTPLSRPPRHPPDRPVSQLLRDSAHRAPQLSQFVRVERILDPLKRDISSPEGTFRDLYRPLNLAYWLGHVKI